MRANRQSLSRAAFVRLAGVIRDDIIHASARDLRRAVSARRRKGLFAKPLNYDRDRVVLLYFEDFERDRFFRGDRRLQRIARRCVHAFRTTQTTSGLETAFRRLVESLERVGMQVIVNDRRLALANPSYPVGYIGYPALFDLPDLPNPSLVGHGPFDHPQTVPPAILKREDRVWIGASEWVAQMWRDAPDAPTRVAVWPAGIDLDKWPDTRQSPKSSDVVIYDKIRWDHERVRADVRAPVEQLLRARGQKYEVLEYGAHDQATYRATLARSRGMVFLCEHENQGLAYQEALASNVPILAWDPGAWHDPSRFDFGLTYVPASSVPYFEDGVTGERFGPGMPLEAALDRFLASLDTYQPRAWVREHLSLEQSAAIYLELYESLLTSRRTST